MREVTRTLAGLVLAAVLVAGAGSSAFVRSLDPQSLAEAIAIGQGRIDAVRTHFHAPYHIDVGKAPVDYIEVVTPFRRVALDAEARTHSGDRLYGQRDALATLGDAPSRVDIVAELTFHPLNTFVGVPDYRVSLEAVAGALHLLPTTFSSIPRFSPRLAGMPLPYPYTVGSPGPARSQPLLGGSIIATFDGPMLDAEGSYWVVVSDSGDAGKDRKELARARVDFGKLR
jgi:hypothetical protein